MSDINTVIVSGRLTEDPVHGGPNNYASCNFKIATMDDEYRSDKTNNQNSVFTIEVRGKFSEVCMKYLRKNREVIVSGKIMKSYWMGFVILAKQVQFMGEKPTQEELARPLQLSAEEPIEPFVRKEQVLKEYPPVGRYRIRILERVDTKSLDIREYHSTPEFEGFTTKGIRLSEVEEIRLLRDSLTEVVDKKLSPI